MPRAIILGSGTSNGVPMIGYRYRPGFLDNPKNHRSRCSLLLEGSPGAFGPRRVLVDCPPELRLQLTKLEVMDLESVIITHTHADHVMGMDDLRSICILRNKSMPIYSLPEHHQDILRIFPYAFREAPPGISYPRFELIEVDGPIESAGLTIHPFVVMHGTVRVVAFRVRDFAYLTDVSFVPEDAVQQLQGLDTLVVDGLRSDPHPNHFNIDQAIAFSERIRPKRTFLTHLTHDFDHNELSARLPSGIEPAFDGLELDI